MNREEYLEMLILDLEGNNLAYWDSTQNEMAKALKEIQQENKQLKEQIKVYENPDDLTLMFMYCDEKAKDKIKDLQQENKQLKEKNEKEFADYTKFKQEQYDKYLDKTNKLIKARQHYKHIIDELEKYLKGNIQELKNQPKDDSVITIDEVNDIVQCNLVFVLAKLQEIKGGKE